MKGPLDLTGVRFGRLLVRQWSEESRPSQIKWLCECDCGVVKTVLGSNLRQGRQKSCGCLNAELKHARNMAAKTTDEAKRANELARKTRYNGSQKAKDSKRKYFEKNRTQCLKRAIEWSKCNPEVVRSAVRNRRARLRGAEGTHSRGDIERIGSEQGWKCAGCGRCVREGFQADHVVPLSKGGGNGPNNLQLLCQPCNGSKGARSLKEFMTELYPELFKIEISSGHFYPA